MGRLTVRLPDTLHHQLTTLAGKEGVSLNQYILYALTRQITLSYVVETVSPTEIEKQQTSFEALLERLGEATSKELEQILTDREFVEPESEVEALAVNRLRERTTARQQ
jgi:hypothetical protein